MGAFLDVAVLYRDYITCFFKPHVLSRWGNVRYGFEFGSCMRDGYALDVVYQTM